MKRQLAHLFAVIPEFPRQLVRDGVDPRTISCLNKETREIFCHNARAIVAEQLSVPVERMPVQADLAAGPCDSFAKLASAIACSERRPLERRAHTKSAVS